VSKQPSLEHQNICIRLGGLLEQWSYDAGLGIVTTAPGVIFSVQNAVAPDLAWVSNERARRGRDAAGHLHIAPELMIEILSPGRANERRDRQIKLSLYSREDVLEYWIVDWQRRTVEVYRRAGASLALALTLGGDDLLETPLLPGFSARLPRIWPQTFEPA
jgi:Uma2 family endonuclease